MSEPDTQTRNGITLRNRRNALKSTGPRTPEGKAIVRRNAVKHGLTAANPAAAGPEEAALFRELHEQLVEELAPRSMIEVGVVHRIAVSLWRLRRAAEIDGAYSTERVERVPISHERTQRWIEQFNECWRWEEVPETDRQKVRWAREAGLIEDGDQQWLRRKRPRLWMLDRLREEMLEEAEGIRALETILCHLWERRLGRGDGRMPPEDIEKMAFILGDSAETFVVNENEVQGSPLSREYTAIDEGRPDQGRMQEMLRKGLTGRRTGPLPAEIESALNACLDSLEQQRELVTSPLEEEGRFRREQMALLPTAKVLDRLQRYETHAERSLYRALGQLAKLRGVTVHFLVAQLSVAAPAGS